jgi:ribA/ribD-fused uncharacterized protein
MLQSLGSLVFPSRFLPCLQSLRSPKGPVSRTAGPVHKFLSALSISESLHLFVLSSAYSLQAAKFNKEEGAKFRELIRGSDSAAVAKDFGDKNFRKPFRVENFRDKNRGIMYDINLAKFQQNQKLLRWLLETDRHIEKDGKRENYIFHTMNSDAFWGIGSLEQDGKYHGQNWNGRILMAVRAVLARTVRRIDRFLSAPPPPPLCVLRYE